MDRKSGAFGRLRLLGLIPAKACAPTTNGVNLNQQLGNGYHHVFHIYYLVCSSFSIIFSLKNFINIRTWRCLSQYVNYAFKSTKKLNHDILGSLNKFKLPGYCIFPLSNPHYAPGLDCVPDDNMGKNLEELCIRRGNLKYLNKDIADSNVKIIVCLNLLSG